MPLDMQNKLLFRITLLVMLTTCIALTYQESSDYRKIREKAIASSDVLRTKRAIKKPGFFKTLFSVVYEQWADTKDTINKVNTMINDNFLPENAPVTMSTTPPPNPNASTTTPPYRITRSEFNRIIARNLRGLRNLYDIELAEALKQSEKNYRDFKKNVSVEVSKFL